MKGDVQAQYDAATYKLQELLENNILSKAQKEALREWYLKEKKALTEKHENVSLDTSLSVLDRYFGDVAVTYKAKKMMEVLEREGTMIIFTKNTFIKRAFIMRLQANLEMSTDWLIKDYRRIFMALIKNIFSAYDPVLYVNLYGTEEQKRKVNKPFTFSLHFPDYNRIEGNKIYCGGKVGLFFSSNDEILVTAFYNGLKKNKQIIIGENYPITFNVKNIQLLPLKKINSNKVGFKTISPVLVNQREDNLIFIPPTHPDFDSTFKNIITNQANELNVSCSPDDIHIEIESMKKLPLTHYNQTMTSWLGKFIMKGPIEVLQLVYDTGIGVRRSQGFGMLEIEKHF